MKELFSFQGTAVRTFHSAACAVWGIALSLGRHREGSIHSIEIEVFQKFSNSLDFDANSRLRDA